MAENEKDKKSAPKAATKSAAGAKRGAGAGPSKDKKTSGGARSGAKSSSKFSASSKGKKDQDQPRKPRVFGPKSESKTEIKLAVADVKKEAKAKAPKAQPEIKAEAPETKPEVSAAPAVQPEVETPVQAEAPAQAETPVQAEAQVETPAQAEVQAEAPAQTEAPAEAPAAAPETKTAAATQQAEAQQAAAQQAAQQHAAQPIFAVLEKDGAQQHAAQPIFAVLEKDGKKYGLNAAQFGQVIKQNYGKLNFPWKQSFWNYQRSHVMFPIMAQLKAGMDPISVNYIDHHELLMTAAFVSELTMIANNALWTPIDRRLFQRHNQMLQDKNLAFLKNTSFDYSSQFTNFYGMYDLPVEVLQQVNGKAIIDGGAYIGDTIHLFRRLFSQSQIYSFEPVKKTFETLSKIYQQDAAVGTVTPINKGLGSKSGTLSINRYPQSNDALASMVVDYKKEHELVEVTTIDEEVKARNLEVGLIKLNVEGFETEAIKGALQTIHEQKPLLVISVGMLPQEFYELKPFIESLNLGYKFALRRSGFGRCAVLRYVENAVGELRRPDAFRQSSEFFGRHAGRQDASLPHRALQCGLRDGQDRLGRRVPKLNQGARGGRSPSRDAGQVREAPSFRRRGGRNGSKRELGACGVRAADDARARQDQWARQLARVARLRNLDRRVAPVHAQPNRPIRL